MSSKHAPLTHMSSTLINWKAIRATLKQVLEVLAVTYKDQEAKTGKTAAEIISGTVNLNFDNCKTAEDITKVIVTFFNYNVPEAFKNRIVETVKDDMEKHNGVFNVKRWSTALLILRPMPLEEKNENIIFGNGCKW